MDWEFFFRQLDAGINVGEICFYFEDDPDEKEHYLGYTHEWEKPYWVGYCDVEDGCSFGSANELVNAPIFDGKTLQERWNQVILCSIEAVTPDFWLESFTHI